MWKTTCLGAKPPVRRLILPEKIEIILDLEKIDSLISLVAKTGDEFIWAAVFRSHFKR